MYCSAKAHVILAEDPTLSWDRAVPRSHPARNGGRADVQSVPTEDSLEVLALITRNGVGVMSLCISKCAPTQMASRNQPAT